MDAFKNPVSRKQTRSVKWDGLVQVFGTEDIIPMWIADMDFPAPQQVIDALVERARHGIFGYTLVDEQVTQPFLDWVAKRHGWQIDANWLSFSPGVVASLDMAVQAFTEPGDKVLVQTPVYNPFYNTIRNHGREIAKNPLLLKDGHYTIDFADFEAQLKSGVKAFILCSPHNPVGRVWKETELRRMAELCVQYNVLILSDEIHCDLVYSGHTHIPIASLSAEISKQTLTFMSPSKTFNLAGLQASYIVTEDDSKRRRLNQMLEMQGHKQLNTMGNTALEAVYRHGEAWLDELLQVLEQNLQFVTQSFAAHAPQLRLIQPEGTYLLWIDCSNLGLDSLALRKFMIEKARVGLNAGAVYGKEGDQFMRMNIACHPETLKEAVNRLIAAVKHM